jgi:hypothetical protein
MWMNIKPSLNARLAWSFTALFAVIDAVGLKAEGMSLDPVSVWTDIIAVAILLASALICTRFLRNPRIAGAAHMVALALIFADLMVIASYLAVALRQPLVDSYLVAADHALGLDWLPPYKWIKVHPLAQKFLSVAYLSLIPQVILVFTVLNLRGQAARGWETMLMFMLAASACVIFSAFWPAAGAYGYYHVELGTPYVRVFTGLHEGTLKVIGGGDSPLQGIVQFPSFHVALALLLTYAVRGMPIFFLCLLEVNALLLIATPALGGHHYADVLGGVVLALMIILIDRKRAH